MLVVGIRKGAHHNIRASGLGHPDPTGGPCKIPCSFGNPFVLLVHPMGFALTERRR